MATEKIKTPSEVIAEFLDGQLKDESLDSETLAAVYDLRNSGDFSKIKLLRKLEDARKVALTADSVSAEERGDD